MNGRRLLPFALIAAAAAGIAAAGCDDAVLGRRPLPCDGSTCDQASGGGGAGGGGCPPVQKPICETGTAIAEHQGGCVSGWFCGQVCTDLGGTCATLRGCPGGRWSTEGFDCSTTDDLGCCRECVPISAPPPDFCDGGPVTEVHEGDCLVDFVCR